MSIQQLLPLGLAFIMFSVGIGLRVKDFKQVILFPKAFSIGLFNQIVLLPVIALIIIAFYEGPPEFALGIMIIAACPGGITSNLLSVLAGGNAALSVSLTAITSVASIVTVPAILAFSHTLIPGNTTQLDMPIAQIMAGIFLITGLPIALGMTMKHKAPEWSHFIQPYARKIATVIFAAIVASAFMVNMDNITHHFVDVGLYLIGLNFLTMSLGFFSAKLLKATRADGITICLETGLQNIALAIVIAVNILGKPELMVPAIIYALIMNISAVIFILRVRKTGAENILPGYN